MKTTDAGAVVWVEAGELRRFSREAALGAGVPETQVDLLVDGLVNATLRGVDAHGVYRLPHYIRGMHAGDLNPAPEPRMSRVRGSVAVLDGDNGLGIVVGQLAMEMAIDRAVEHGVGMVAVQHSNHSGMLATHAMRASARSMLGYFTSNAPALMAPAIGSRAVLSNGPSAWAIPRGQHPPIVFDTAWSEASRSKVRLAALEGQQIPETWAVGPDGQATSDPAQALKGALLPAGGHKGYGVALVNDVLSGALAGANMPFEMSDAALAEDATSMDSWGAGHLAMAIDVTAFVAREDFDVRVERMVAAIREASQQSSTEVLLPGEPESRIAEARAARGVPISLPVIGSLDAFARESGLEPLDRG